MTTTTTGVGVTGVGVTGVDVVAAGDTYTGVAVGHTYTGVAVALTALVVENTGQGVGDGTSGAG